MRRTLGWAGAAVLAIVGLCAPSAWARPSAHKASSPAFVGADIGTVDVQRLQTEYQRATDLQNELEADQEKFQADLQEGQQKIQALQDEIASDDAAVAAATGDIKVKQQLKTRDDAAHSRLDQVREDFATRLQQRKEESDAIEKELDSTVLGNARKAVATVARRRHLEGVIDSRVGLLGLPDITDEVLALLNASPSAAPKAKAAPRSR